MYSLSSLPVVCSEAKLPPLQTRGPKHYALDIFFSTRNSCLLYFTCWVKLSCRMDRRRSNVYSEIHPRESFCSFVSITYAYGCVFTFCLLVSSIIRKKNPSKSGSWAWRTKETFTIPLRAETLKERSQQGGMNLNLMNTRFIQMGITLTRRWRYQLSSNIRV